MQKSKSSWKITCWFVILYLYVNVIYYYNNIQRRNKQIMILEPHHLGLPWDLIEKIMWKFNLIMWQKHSFVLQIFL